MTAFKKPLCGLMAILLTFVFIAATPLSVFAEDEATTYSAAEIELNKQTDKDTGLEYIRIEEDSAIEIVGYTGKSTSVKVPSRIGSLSVISIGANAFAGNKTIEEVILHSDITVLGDCAFKDCTSLKVIDKTKSLATIGVSCFEGCASLESFEVPDNVTTVPERCFYGCEALSEVEEHKNLKSVANDAFSGTAWENAKEDGPLNFGRILYSYKGDVKDIVIPKGVSIIEDGAFLGCESIQTLELGYDVEEIGLYAFQNCVNLKSVVINDALGVIEAGAFKGCKSLKSLDFSESTLATIGYEAFSGCEALSDVKLCETISDIGDYAFRGTSLKSIYFDKNMATIGVNTFLDVSTLAEFEVSDKNKNFDAIDGVLFSEKAEKIICFPEAKLAGDKYELPDSVKEIGEKAFYGAAVACVSLGENSSLERIGTSAFENSQISILGLKYSNVTKIEPSTFKNATELASFSLPEGLTYIGAEAFAGCSALEEIEIPDTVTDIANGAFEGAGLVSVNVGDGVAKLSSNAFANNSKLTDVYLGKRLEVISDNAFANCTSLVAVNLPASLEDITANAFAGCDNLATIVVDSNNKNYKSESNAVYSADGKTLIFVGKAKDVKVAEGTEVISANAFDIAKDALTITFPATLKNVEGNALDVTAWYAAQDKIVYACNVLYKVKGLVANVTVKEDATAIADNAVMNNAAVKSISLPATIEYIGDNAFAASGIVDIVIPDSVLYIGSGAFNGATALESVQLSKGIKIIEASTFKGCGKLTSIVIPDAVETISADAFAGCVSLTELKMTAVKEIEQYAFTGCSAITEINLPKTIESVDPLSFYGCTKLSKINVEDGNEKFKSIDGVVFVLGEGDEPTFDTLAIYPAGKSGAYAVPADVKFIADKAFYNCDGLTAITFADGFERIGNESFYGCDGIKSVEVPESTKSIGDYAFAACGELRDFIVNTNLTVYAGNAFDGCPYFAYDLVYNAGEDGKSNTSTIIVIAVVIVLIAIVAYLVYNKKQKKLQQEIIEKNKIKEALESGKADAEAAEAEKADAEAAEAEEVADAQAEAEAEATEE